MKNLITKLLKLLTILELENIKFTRNPHLSVYRAQRDSLLSIFHRFSMMSVYVAILLCNFWLIFPNGFNFFFCIVPGLCEWIYDLIKIMVFIFGVFYLCMWNTEQQGQAVRLSFQNQERFYSVNWMSWVLVSSLFVVVVSQIYLI